MGHWSTDPISLKPMTRGNRRASRARLIARTRRIARDFWGYHLNDGAYNSLMRRSPHWDKKGADHPNECDHWLCKSPRVHAKGPFKLTRREQKHLLRLKDDE